MKNSPALSKVEFQQGDPDALPWRLPSFQRLRELEFRRPVVFFVGENGTGKSMLLEGIAEARGYDLTSGSRNAVVGLQPGDTR